MKFTSTRSDVEVDSLYTVLRGLAADGGLYVPAAVPRLDASAIPSIRDLAGAERVALGAMFDDIPADVREAAIANLLAKFPAEDPIPLVEADGLHVMELFHGPTGAFKDVALSVLPVLMAEAARKQAGGRKVLILTATSGDTGSAAMAGFADVPGVEIAVFFPNVGTSSDDYAIRKECARHRDTRQLRRCAGSGEADIRRREIPCGGGVCGDAPFVRQLHQHRTAGSADRLLPACRREACGQGRV